MPARASLRFLFVVNPHAGGQQKNTYTKAIEAHFKGSPHQYSLFETTGNGDCEALLLLLEKQCSDRLVAVGGDGTLKLVAEVAQKHPVTVGMIPAGSANGMAAELELPTDVEAALQVVTGTTERNLDLVCVNEHYSLHLSDLGLNAQLIQFFEQGETRGLLGYAREVLRTLRQSKSLRLTLTLDGKAPIQRKAAMVVLANGRMYGSGVVLNEAGALDDGYFEVVVLHRVSLLRVLGCLLRRRAAPGPTQEVFKVQKLLLECRRPAPYQVDGEFLGETRSVEATILPGAVRMLVPDAGENALRRVHSPPMATTRITINNNGSMKLEGDFEIVDRDGTPYGLGGRTVVSICRCGLSQNKPFCDGAHRGHFEHEATAFDLPPKKDA